MRCVGAGENVDRLFCLIFSVTFSKKRLPERRLKYIFKERLAMLALTFNSAGAVFGGGIKD
jgi:hypothetical protein